MSSTAKADRERLAFRDRLMRMRKSRDAYPWISVLKKVWTSGVVGTQDHKFQHQKQQDVYASELVHSNSACGNANADGTGSLTLTMPHWDGQLLSGTNEQERASALAPADQIFGGPDVTQILAPGAVELKRFVTGLRIPPMEVIRLLARTQPHTAGVHTGYPYSFEHALWVAFRGYQLLQKGSNTTPQLTYAEFADRGYQPEAFNVVFSVNLPATMLPTDAEKEATYTIPTSKGLAFHATDFITLRSTALLGYEAPFATQLLVKLEGFERPIMDDFVPMCLLGSHLQRNAWQFPQPLSVPVGTQLKLRVKSRVPITWADSSNLDGRAPAISVVLHGHNLVRA
jgi:hypothetical protein